MRIPTTLLLIILFVCVYAQEGGESHSHYFKKGDKIDLIADKLWPRGNPSESYDYFFLPFCGDDEREHVGQDLGADMTGSRRVKTKYDIHFQSEFIEN